MPFFWISAVAGMTTAARTVHSMVQYLVPDGVEGQCSTEFEPSNPIDAMATGFHLVPMGSVSGSGKASTPVSIPNASSRNKKALGFTLENPNASILPSQCFSFQSSINCGIFYQYIYLVAECNIFFDVWILRKKAMKELFANTDLCTIGLGLIYRSLCFAVGSHRSGQRSKPPVHALLLR